MPDPIITLTTDFGLEDCYVGVMKGVIWSRNPSTKIIDLTHRVHPQDIRQAASLIYGNFSYFPEGTLHVIIVDPSVGSNREILLAEASGHFFLAPNNGVLSHFIDNKMVKRAFVVSRDDLYLQPTSQTFHGRDIFAPVAAFLTAGNLPETVGPTIEVEKLTTIDLPRPQIDKANMTLKGEIIHIDHYGNLSTNITMTDLETLPSPKNIEVVINTHTIKGLRTNYTAVPLESLLLLINSQNSLEIAVNQGNAQNITQASLYETVVVKGLTDQPLTK